jgi:hypothetical protein
MVKKQGKTNDKRSGGVAMLNGEKDKAKQRGSFLGRKLDHRRRCCAFLYIREIL